MFVFPKNLPIALVRALTFSTNFRGLEEALPSIGDAIMQLFSADAALVFFNKDSLLLAEKDFYSYRSGKHIEGVSATEQFVKPWSELGISRLVEKDLQARLTALSYSAFSWPYPRFEIKDLSDEVISLPYEYCLLLPFSSDLVVAHESEKRFFGYTALFFDRFPDLSEATVQLIITLPDLLSSLVAGYLRQSLAAKAADLSTFAHDIKRYLLLTREFISVLKEEESAEAERALAAMERSVIRLQHQTDSLLLADKDEFGNLKVNPVLLNFNDLIKETIVDFLPLFDQAQIRLMPELNGMPQLKVDPALFPSVVQNLLDNALRYSASGTTVTVRTRFEADMAILEVIDQGRAVPPDETEKIFTKRFRGSNVQGKQGNGLGLYLVRKIVEAHYGKVSLRQDGGAEKSFVVVLPRARSGDATSERELKENSGEVR